MKVLLWVLVFSPMTFASVSSFKQNNISYRANYGECPIKSSSDLVIHIMKEFEKNHSLKEVKESFVEAKWNEKYFLKEYKVSFNPIKKMVNIELECPKPLARVQVYRENGSDHYTATLTAGGKLFDPAYETLLKNEKVLKTDLPSLVLPVEVINNAGHEKIAHFLTLIEPSLSNRFSEIIVSKNEEMTLIFSSSVKPTNVFLGKDLWEDKLVKLTKIIQFMDKANKRPSIINLTSLKKVVVKF